MKVSEIEKHKIALEYEDWHAYQLEHYSPTPGRTVYVVHTDEGLVGLTRLGSEAGHAVAEVPLPEGGGGVDGAGQEAGI